MRENVQSVQIAVKQGTGAKHRKTNMRQGSFNISRPVSDWVLYVFTLGARGLSCAVSAYSLCSLLQAARCTRPPANLARH